MQIGMMGLGRMGGNMARRLMRAGHECIAYDVNPAAVEALVKDGAIGISSIEQFLEKLTPPRAVWIMLPAAITPSIVEKLAAFMQPGDMIIDGGNSNYRDAVDQSDKLSEKGISYIDVGTSGGVWGLERGFCLMIGGPEKAVKHLDPIFAALAPGADLDPSLRPAERGYLHCGPSGAGHFVKMVHNGIEYGMMQAYAEGFNVLKQAGVGHAKREADAETTPFPDAHYYQFDMDIEAISEVWRHGSVIGSWLLDLTADAVKADPSLSDFGGRVSDSGEGRWTMKAAIDIGVPVPVLSAAVFSRFDSQGNADYTNKMLSAMRKAFGGHIEKPHGK